MSKKALIAVCAILSVMLSLAPVAGLTPAMAQGAPTPQAMSPVKKPVGAPIRLKADTFNPLAGEEPSVAPSLAAPAVAADQQAEYLIQFGGPIQDGWLEQVESLGVQLLDYIPDYAFHVRMTPRVAKQVQLATNIIWVGQFHPAYKLAPELVRDGTNLYKVLLDPGADLDAFATSISGMGGQTLSLAEGVAVVQLDGGRIDQVAVLPDVSWVTNHYAMELDNGQAAGQINAAPAWNVGWTGAGQVVGVTDTGIDTGRDNLSAKGDMHADLDNRVVKIQSWPIQPDWATYVETPGADDGAADLDSGHGTHVAGSVAGNGARSNGQNKGIAPSASLVFQAVEQYVNYNSYGEGMGGRDGYYLYGIPNDLNQLFSQSYGWGARIHTNSWGGGAPGAYDAESQDADEFIWAHKDMTILFSAGNDGADRNRDGKVDYGSITSPATAKNVISVGASENLRLTPSPNTNSGTYGGWWPSDFPTEPLRSDPMADAGAKGMVAFSSRGPTTDGRIKPDVVAPGTWILSTRSSKATGAGWGTPPNAYYQYMGGTSMATPLTAGAAALVREFYAKAMNHPNSSAALIKATLINTAADMPGQYSGSANEAGPIPNNDEGWGVINIGSAVDGAHRYFEDQNYPLTTNRTQTFPLEVNGSRPLRVTVAWSDYPGAVQAGVELVNDLDLAVVAPDGTRYQGNVFAYGWSAKGGSPDRLNNVECVYLQNPKAGTYQIQVTGYNVPKGPQPFALVVSADVKTACTDENSASIDAPTEGQTLAGVVSVEGWAADFASATGTGVTGVEIWLDGAKIGDAAYGYNRPDIAATYGARFGPSGFSFQWGTRSASNGPHILELRTNGTCGWEITARRSVTVQNAACQLAIAIDAPSASAPVSGQINIIGWALDLQSASGPGVDYVSFYLDGDPTTGRYLGQVSTFGPRPDLAAFLGQQFLNSGFSFPWNTRTVSNGTHMINAYAHSPACGNSAPSSRQVLVQNAACILSLVVDAPTPTATVRGTVPIIGWALDQLSQSGTGVDSVRVYLDGDKNSGTLLGQVTSFTPRPDLASLLGPRFLNSGYTLPWNTTTASNGAHTLYVYAHSPTCGDSSPVARQVTVQNAQCQMVLAIDAPAASATVKGRVSVIGWGLDMLAGVGNGLDMMSLYLDGPAGTGVPLGDVTTFTDRPDLANLLNPQFLESGFTFVWDTTGVPNGTHLLYVYAHSPTCGYSAPATRTVNVQNSVVSCLVALSVDAPAEGATVQGQTPIVGWALDQRSQSGTGIDRVRAYLDGTIDTGELVFDTTSFVPRQDLANLLGSQFLNCGFQGTWDTTGTADGAHALYIYAHSPACGWSSPVTRQVIVANAGAVLLYNDDFSAPRGWFVGTSANGVYELLNGAYRILVNTPNWTLFSAAPTPTRYTDCQVRADIQFATATYGFYGLILGVQDDWSGYHFHVDGYGYFALFKLKAGTWQTLLDWTFSPALHTGQAPNRLRVERRGATINLYANGSLLATTTDTEFVNAGRVGVVAGSYGDTPVDVRFDNFSVYSIGNVPSGGSAAAGGEAEVGAAGEAPDTAPPSPAYTQPAS